MQQRGPSSEEPPKGSGVLGGTRPRAPLVSWTRRVAQLSQDLERFAVERLGPPLRAAVAEQAAAGADDAEIARLLEDRIVALGSAGDGRSLVRAFAEEAEGLEPSEREQLLRWERERRRAVHVVERCLPELLDVWDPVEGVRLVIYLPERLPGARASEVERGSLAVVTSAPWTTRTLARGRVEFWSDPRALALYRTEVRASGRTWHDLPPAAPRRS